MKCSKYLQIIDSCKEGALCYHSLLGNLFFLIPEYLNALNSFKTERRLNNDEKESAIIADLFSAGYIEERDNSRAILAENNRRWIDQLPDGGQLRLLNLIVSEICNFGCEHCLHKCSTAVSQSHGRKKIMDWQIARVAIDEYVSVMNKWHRRPLDIQFGSAEPLLNWPVVKKAIGYAKSLDPEAHFTINTNLSLLTTEMAEYMRDNKVYIATSLDGPKEANDKIRTYLKGEGTFDDILVAANLLESIGYPLDGFSITINNLNFDLIDSDFIDWAAERGFKGIATDIDLINMQNADRSVSDCVEKLMELRYACAHNKLESFGSWTTAYHTLVNGVEDGMTTFCKAVKGYNISVNPSGHLFICGHTTTLLGNVSSFSKALSKGSNYEQLVKSRLPGNDPMCFGCSIEGMCAGQCHITREIAKKTGNGRDTYLCDFYRKITHKLLNEKLLEEINDYNQGGGEIAQS